MSDTFWSNYNAGSRSVNDFADRLYQRQAAQSLAGGDYTSAMQNIARTGDLAKVGAVQDLQVERQKAERTNQEQAAARSAAFARQAAGALKSAVANGQDPLTAFDAMSPAMSQMGVTPEQQQEFRAALQANPAGLIQGIEAWADGEERKLSFQKAGDSVLVFQEGNPDPVRTYEAPRQPIKVGDVLVDPVTYEPILDAREPRYQTVTNSDGTTSVVAIDQPAPIRGGSSTGGNIDAILDGIIRREGGYVARDGRSGAPANFGINQRANPDVDVANLTEDQARQIYRDRYITPIVEAGVSGPALEAVIDFGVNAGVQRSLGLWRQSGGDIDEFNRLRLQHYRSLPDYNQHGRSWERRVAETTPGQRGAEVSVGGGSRVVARGQNTGPAVRTLSAQEKRDLGLPENGVYQRKADGTITAVSGQGGDRLSAGQQRQVETYYQEIAGLDNIDAELGRFDRMIETGELELSPVANVIGGARNALGISSENSRNLAEFQATLERVRNDSLRLNKGVQTEGDAQRAWNELIANINDPAVVRRQLRRIQEINTRARRFRQQRINALESGGGQQARQVAQPMPSVRFPPSSAQLQQWRALPRTGSLGSRTNPILINPESATQSFNNVPRGGYFITPDGQFLGPKP